MKTSSLTGSSTVNFLPTESPNCLFRLWRSVPSLAACPGAPAAVPAAAFPMETSTRSAPVGYPVPAPPRHSGARRTAPVWTPAGGPALPGTAVSERRLAGVRRALIDRGRRPDARLSGSALENSCSGRGASSWRPALRQNSKARCSVAIFRRLATNRCSKRLRRMTKKVPLTRTDSRRTSLSACGTACFGWCLCSMKSLRSSLSWLHTSELSAVAFS